MVPSPQQWRPAQPAAWPGSARSAHTPPSSRGAYPWRSPTDDGPTILTAGNPDARARIWIEVVAAGEQPSAEAASAGAAALHLMAEGLTATRVSQFREAVLGAGAAEYRAPASRDPRSTGAVPAHPQPWIARVPVNPAAAVSVTAGPDDDADSFASWPAWWLPTPSGPRVGAGRCSISADPRPHARRLDGRTRRRCLGRGRAAARSNPMPSRTSTMTASPPSHHRYRAAAGGAGCCSANAGWQSIRATQWARPSSNTSGGWGTLSLVSRMRAGYAGPVAPRP